MQYDIFISGHLSTGSVSEAKMIAECVEAESFEHACIAFSKTPQANGFGRFCPKELSFFGCRLYDNLDDARKSFG